MQGANVKKLIVHKIALDAIPPGGDFLDGLRFLANKEAISTGARMATQWVESAIEAVRQAADPNPWRNADDEVIAGEILRQIKAKKERLGIRR